MTCENSWIYLVAHAEFTRRPFIQNPDPVSPGGEISMVVQVSGLLLRCHHMEHRGFHGTEWEVQGHCTDITANGPVVQELVSEVW